MRVLLARIEESDRQTLDRQTLSSSGWEWESDTFNFHEEVDGATSSISTGAGGAATSDDNPPVWL